MLRHLLQQIGHHPWHARCAAAAQLLAHVGGEQVGELAVARLLLAQQQIADVQQLQQPAVTLWLYPAAGMHNRATADLKHEVQALPMPISGRAFEGQRAARHQIID